MANLVEDVGALVKGLGTTFKHMFRPTTTVQYPEQKRPVYPRFRGRHMLMRRGIFRFLLVATLAWVAFVAYSAWGTVPPAVMPISSPMRPMEPA